MTEGSKPSPLVEITRSYSRKLNTGNYTTLDFFCSRKEECLVKDAPVTSARLHGFCQAEVLIAVDAYKKSLVKKPLPPRQRDPVDIDDDISF